MQSRTLYKKSILVSQIRVSSVFPLHDTVIREHHEIYTIIPVLWMKRWEVCRVKRLAQSDKLVRAGTGIQT